jgi:hypothetical protein
MILYIGCDFIAFLKEERTMSALEYQSKVVSLRMGH